MATRPAEMRRIIGQYFGLAILLIIIVLPIGWIAGYSIAGSFGAIGMFSDGWTLRHWQAALAVGGLKESLMLSLAVSAVTTFAAVVVTLGCVLSWPQARHRLRVLMILGVGMATPAAVAAIVVYQLLNPGGVFARIAFHLGLIDTPSEFPVLVNDVWSIGIILAGIGCSVPLLTMTCLKIWTTAKIDRCCGLAESLGASRWQARWRIARPMLLHRIRPLILLTFLWNLGSFEIPLLLGRQSPQMISVLIQRRAGQFDVLQRPQAFALAAIYLLLVGMGVVIMLTWRPRRV